MTISKMLRFIKKFGIIDGARLFFDYSILKKSPFRFFEYGNIHLRYGSSDIHVFEDIFIKEFYKSHAFEKILPDYEPSVIVDAGANIGLSSIYFSKKYKKARVIAIEPELSNFTMLKANLVGSDIIVENKALWNSHTSLSLRNVSVDFYSFSYEENKSDERGVDTITIEELFSKYNIDRIGILKVDIEGAEKELFSGNTNWLEKIDILIIELHDFMKKGCSSTLFKALEAYEFSQLLNFENNIFINERLLTDFRKKQTGR